MTKTEELESVLGVVRAEMTNCQRQNEKLIRTVRFYADPVAWSDRRVALLDRGELARTTLKEVIG